MSAGPSSGDASHDYPQDHGVEIDGESMRFLRNAQIFATSVHEVLEQRILHAICESPLSRSQFHLLRLMSLVDGCQVHDVATLLGVSVSAATKTLDKLLNLGFIRRRPTRQDGRGTWFTLSVKGRQLVRQYMTTMSEPYTRVFDALSRSEQTNLADMLERFALGLLGQVDRDSDTCLRCAAFYDELCSVGKLRGRCPVQEILSRRQTVT